MTPMLVKLTDYRSGTSRWITPELKIADAIREVTIAVQKAIADGYRSRMIDADDLVEMLLAIADRLDPPEDLPMQQD